MEKSQKKRARQAVEEMGKQARRASKRFVRTLAETPELVNLERNERALKNELDYHLREIGLRALRIHNRAMRKTEGESPFSGLSTILDEIETIEALRDDIQSNRERIAKIKEKIRDKK